VVLARDNDPKHRSNYSRTWKSDHQIVTLPWPSLSPDINPVENLWSFLKVKVAQRRPKTLEDLVNAIKNEWNELPSELAYNLMNSMENRVQSVIDSGGDYIL
jgi:transposase